MLKNQRTIVSFTLMLASVFLFGGCANISSTVAPGTSLASIKEIHVVPLPADGRGVNQIIADQLNMMGYTATTGPVSSMPEDADALLTYQDKWMWDITMYMIELNLQLRQPKTDIAIATVKTYRPSLQRKSPEGMAEEALTELFKQK